MTRTVLPRYYPRMLGLRRNARGTSVLVVVLLLTAALPLVAQRRERKRQERVEISQLEEQWRRAQVSDDIPEMDRLLAEDFLGITAAGRVVTKAQQLERMRTQQIALKRMDISDTKIKISGNVAVVTSMARIDGSMDGHPIDGSFRYTRVYQRAPSAGWRITNFEATRVPGAMTAIGSGADPRDGFRAPQGAVPAPRSAGPSFLPASQAAPGSPRPQS